MTVTAAVGISAVRMMGLAADEATLAPLTLSVAQAKTGVTVDARTCVDHCANRTCAECVADELCGYCDATAECMVRGCG